MSRTLGLVVPAFRPNVDALRAYVSDLDERLEPAAIRIELDDPRPETVESLEALPATINAVDDRRGKGAAVTAGFCALETDVLAFADADGSTAVDSIETIVDRAREGGADLVVGTRRHPEADVLSSQSALRERLGDAFAWLARRLLAVSVSDYQCGAKAIDAEAWTAVCPHLREHGFAWDVELIALADALGYRIEEVPVTWADAPDSTVSSVETPLELVRGAVRARRRATRVSASEERDDQGSRRWRPLSSVANRPSEPTRVIERLELERGANAEFPPESDPDGNADDD
ncbi:dolichol-P-glucose transferase [Halobiforma lacisalsi AJ5]|uniref:Dolichol-P-glucose transferase n=1 Tax=Natronobacterium lacisalsi AJ5 TaxID=358396 RepID=M0LS88_NATLA|nr:glycosyltransferase [Halobiforma lacisalsi]APW99841.1 dolichol-P-glucose transferase [Halobiforma lacisalsi AJ5]EMA35978.1 dolichol-P-glucose transferase [Halobiforma lacisalsi AJ5]